MNIFKKALILILFILLGGLLSITYAQTKNLADPENTQVMKELLKIFFPTSKGVSNGNTISSQSSSNNSSPIEATAVKDLRELFDEISQKVKVPARIIEGVLLVESPGFLSGLTDEQVQVYSKPGTVIPNCRPNACSAMGPMQMTTGIDNSGSSSCSDCGLNQCPNAWAGFGDSVNTMGGYSHLSNPCNLRDNIYAAAAKLKNNSGAGSGAWTKEQVYRAAERYYGSCSDKYRYERLKNKTYCEFLWWYYTGQE